MDYISGEAYKTSNIEKIYILGCGTTYVTLKDERFFSKIKLTQTVVNTISAPVDLIEGSVKANLYR